MPQKGDIRRHIGGEQGVQHHQTGKQVVDDLFRILQMAVIGGGHAPLKHQYLIQEKGDAYGADADQQPPVAGAGVGHQKQHRRGIDIAFVNHGAEGADQKNQRSRRQEQTIPAFGEEIHGEGIQIRPAEADPGKDGPQPVLGKGVPVKTQQFVEVQGVDGDAGIAAHGAAVEIYQPGSGADVFLMEHQSEDQQKPQGRGEAKDHPAEILRGMPPDQFHRQRKQAQGRKQQRLGLDEHGQGDHEQRQGVITIHQQHRPQQGEEGEHRITQGSGKILRQENFPGNFRQS